MGWLQNTVLLGGCLSAERGWRAEERAKHFISNQVTVIQLYALLCVCFHNCAHAIPHFQEVIINFNHLLELQTGFWLKKNFLGS